MSFLNTDLFLLRVNYEDCIRDTWHILDTAKVLLKLLPLLLQLDNFLLWQYIKGTVLRHGLDLTKTSDSALDGLEVSKHTTKPSLVYIIHTTSLCLSCYCILCLLLCSYEKDVSALCSNVEDSLVSFVNLAYRLLQVDDVDTVSLGIDVWSHLRVPSSGLMSKMNTSFKQLLHRNNAHVFTLLWFVFRMPYVQATACAAPNLPTAYVFFKFLSPTIISWKKYNCKAFFVFSSIFFRFYAFVLEVFSALTLTLASSSNTTSLRTLM